MSKESSSGLGVDSRFGTLNLPDAAAGVYPSDGPQNTLAISVGGANINGAVVSDAFVLPAGALVTAAYVNVTEAFSAGFAVGTKGSEATNGVDIVGTSTGLLDISASIAGTWAAQLAASTIVDAAWATSGTDAGYATVIVEYIQLSPAV